MTEASRPERKKAARQVHQQLESLRAAGVEYLPNAEPATLPEAKPGASLFAEVDRAADAAADLNPEQRRRELHVLAEKVAGCTRCAELVANRSQTVFGVGPIDAELCFIGEGPGQEEDRRGEPFVGPAGQLLNRIIAACGMKREEVYICNIVKCQPPGNRQPLPDEAGNCREYLERQLELIRPKFICALGATAAQNLLGTSLSISRLRGRFQDYRGIPVMCTFHPAYLLRSPEKKREVWEDMKALLQRMGRPIPGPSRK
jgi:DNA polymerase